MFVAPFAAEKHNATPIQSAYLVSIMAATELVGRLPWGILADKPGMNRHFLLSMDCLGMGVAFFAIPFLPSYTTIAFLYGFSGFFQGLLNFEGIFKMSYFKKFFGELDTITSYTVRRTYKGHQFSSKNTSCPLHVRPLNVRYIKTCI